jgi:hypothetical protein
MSDTLTYQYLATFYEKAKARMQPAILAWVQSQASSKVGGIARLANEPLGDEAVVDASDPVLYKKVYNACVKWAGQDLAKKIAATAVGEVKESHITDEAPYRDAPVQEETVTEVDIDGLDDNVAGRFLLELGSARTSLRGLRQ